MRVETVPVPLDRDGSIGHGEVLVRIDTCGICGTDLKKIHAGSHSAPRIFGHEMAGTIAMVGDEVTGFEIGDRVMAYHHIPCGECTLPQTDLCAVRDVQEVGCTAGFAPAGGGFAEYIRRERGDCRQRGKDSKTNLRFPTIFRSEPRRFREPVNTCFKAVRLLNWSRMRRSGDWPGAEVRILLAGLVRRTAGGADQAV